MRYEGKISRIKQIIVSDPSYAKGVWCRYENDETAMSNCKVQISIAKYHEIIPAEEVAKEMPESLRNQVINDLELEGIEFQVLIADSLPLCKLVDNGFTHPSWLKTKEYTIGMDTACVSIGINDVADKIRSEKELWQPSTALSTLTDGEFGYVVEGTMPQSGITLIVYICGSFDKDTELTEEDILNYLEKNLQIEDLHPIETAQQTENELEIGGI